MTANAGVLPLKPGDSSTQHVLPIRVLMADPDESLQPVYRDALTCEGFKVDAALSGLECVARLHEQVPDLLVLELQLPWGGGDGVLARMEEFPHLALVPVMILTSCRDDHVFHRMAHFSVSDYHLKPLAPGRLARRLRTLLKYPRLRFALADQSARLECSIARRTDGRVRELRVERVEGGVLVRGRTDSHYVKQLALAAVQEALSASDSPSEMITLDIEVG